MSIAHAALELARRKAWGWPHGFPEDRLVRGGVTLVALMEAGPGAWADLLWPFFGEPQPILEEGGIVAATWGEFAPWSPALTLGQASNGKRAAAILLGDTLVESRGLRIAGLPGKPPHPPLEIPPDGKTSIGGVTWPNWPGWGAVTIYRGRIVGGTPTGVVTIAPSPFTGGGVPRPEDLASVLEAA